MWPVRWRPCTCDSMLAECLHLSSRCSSFGTSLASESVLLVALLACLHTGSAVLLARSMHQSHLDRLLSPCRPRQERVMNQASHDPHTPAGHYSSHACALVSTFHIGCRMCMVSNSLSVVWTHARNMSGCSLRSTAATRTQQCSGKLPLCLHRLTSPSHFARSSFQSDTSQNSQYSASSCLTRKPPCAASLCTHGWAGAACHSHIIASAEDVWWPALSLVSVLPCLLLAGLRAVPDAAALQALVELAQLAARITRDAGSRKRFQSFCHVLPGKLIRVVQSEALAKPARGVGASCACLQKLSRLSLEHQCACGPWQTPNQIALSS